ncbi:TrbC/VirB2 family protein [Cytobacillus sp.]|uniref:TrbC/VirB2 family protein n=1 Tax=Cytobacillus sp. TaxID=2675269 RepID=UPI0028BD7AA6|nr:TrbC/VirB2 family protein [Cytobacillus sp.]
MNVQIMSINEFMAGNYINRRKQKKVSKLVRRIGTSITVPLIMAKPAFAATTEAVPATAKEWMGEQTLSALAHVLDPVVDILVALAFPVASVVIVGACFLFMFGSAERAWTMIQNAGLGYVLIQVSPLILNVLKQVGNAV